MRRRSLPKRHTITILVITVRYDLTRLQYGQVHTTLIVFGFRTVQTNISRYLTIRENKLDIRHFKDYLLNLLTL